MKRLTLATLLASLAFGAVLTQGCVDPTVDVCTTNAATFTVHNVSNERVRMELTGGASASTYFVENSTDDSTSLIVGTYRVKAIGLATGLTLSDSLTEVRCDRSYDLTLTPAQPPVTHFAELDVANDTNEQLDIYIDGVYENRLDPGAIGEYDMNEAYHTLRVVQVSTNAVLHETNDYYYQDAVATISITSTYPEVEIHNLLSGVDAQCVNTFANQDPINFGSDLAPIWDVCPAEVGSFALFRGDYQIEVIGQDTPFTYIDDSQLFPENTTTIYEVQ